MIVCRKIKKLEQCHYDCIHLMDTYEGEEFYIHGIESGRLVMYEVVDESSINNFLGAFITRIDADYKGELELVIVAARGLMKKPGFVEITTNLIKAIAQVMGIKTARVHTTCNKTAAVLFGAGWEEVERIHRLDCG